MGDCLLLLNHSLGNCRGTVLWRRGSTSFEWHIFHTYIFSSNSGCKSNKYKWVHYTEMSPRIAVMIPSQLEVGHYNCSDHRTEPVEDLNYCPYDSQGWNFIPCPMSVCRCSHAKVRDIMHYNWSYNQQKTYSEILRSFQLLFFVFLALSLFFFFKQMEKTSQNY